jgi:hypothetical protein
MMAKTKNKSEELTESGANEQRLDGPQESKTEIPLSVIIERRAYEIYQQRGDGEGDSVSDWLCAEREVLHDVARKSARETARREAPQSESAGLRQKSSAGG